MSDEEIERVRRWGKRWIPPKGGAGHFARLQDEKLTKEHEHDLNKGNHCRKCHMVLTARGTCPMGCDD